MIDRRFITTPGSARCVTKGITLPTMIRTTALDQVRERLPLAQDCRQTEKLGMNGEFAALGHQKGEEYQLSPFTAGNQWHSSPTATNGKNARSAEAMNQLGKLAQTNGRIFSGETPRRNLAA